MLGARTLVPTDEGRYAEMAREMVATGDWITPRLNGIKYFEKPPLQTWMNAITFEVFGLGEWQARLWTGLSGLLGIFLVGLAGTHLVNRRTGITAAIVLASSFWWAGLGHINTLDMGLSGMMTLALCSMLMAQRDNASKTEQRNWMLLCWAGMALATLSKGPIGIVLPGGVLFLYTFFARDWRIWQRLHLGKGLLVFFAITAPWFILVSRANPEFLHFFFIHEHWERFTSKVHNRSGPWYYFIPLLIVGIFPWLGLVIRSMWDGATQRASNFQPGKLLLVWAVFIFLFFSVSDSKLPSYILPIFPALALLIGMYLENKGSFGGMLNSAVMGGLGLCGLLACIFSKKIPALQGDTYEAILNQGFVPWVAGASLIVLLAGIASWSVSKRDVHRAVWIMAWAGFIGGQVLMLGHEPWGRYLAGADHLAAVKVELTPETTLYSVGRYEQVIPFYLRHTFVLVEHPDELSFGLEHEPHLWIPKREDFVKQWLEHQANGVPAIALIRPDIYESFVEQGIPMRVLSKDSRRIFVSSDIK